MITSEQRQKLNNLAKQVGFKAVTRGSHIIVSNKCATLAFANNEAGYRDAKQRLGDMIAKPAVDTIKPCQYRVLRETYEGMDRKGNVIYRRTAQACTLPAIDNGWCEAHQHAAQVMEIGIAARFHGLQLGSLEIGCGYSAWLAYAVIAEAKRVRQIRQADLSSS